MGNIFPTAEVPAFEPLVPPRDADGFVVSFAIEEQDAIREFFDQYGFVVIRDVLTSEETEAGVTSIWNTISKPGVLERDDPATWDKFPSNSSIGIVGNILPEDEFAWQLRQHPRLHAAYAAVLGTDDLLVSLDRYGFMRPTKGVVMKDGSVEDRPQWKSAAQWFHWDLNPWDYLRETKLTEEEEEEYFKQNETGFDWDNALDAIRLFVTENNHRPQAHFAGSHKVQGLVALLDAPENGGGFICVPGFHKYLEHWVAKNKKTTRAPFVPLNHDAPDIACNAQRIPMRKGGVCIWNSRLPHCNFPNEGSNPRACFYVKMFPRSSLPVDLDGFLAARARALKKGLPESFEVTDLGRRVFGLDALAENE